MGESRPGLVIVQAEITEKLIPKAVQVQVWLGVGHGATTRVLVQGYLAHKNPPPYDPTVAYA